MTAKGEVEMSSGDWSTQIFCTETMAAILRISLLHLNEGEIKSCNNK